MNRRDIIFSDFIKNDNIPLTKNIVIFDNIQLKENHISQIIEKYENFTYINSLNKKLDDERVTQLDNKTLLSNIVYDNDTLVVSFYYIQSLSFTNLQTFIHDIQTHESIVFYMEEYNCRGENQVVFDIIFMTELLNDKSLDIDYKKILETGGTLYYSK